MQKAGCIPEPSAPDDLVGSSSAFCACVPYIDLVCLHTCMEIIPTGTDSLYNATLFFNKTPKIN